MHRILVVDDDQAVRGAIEMLLVHKGFEVVVKDSGRDGIAAVESSAFDLIIVDMLMPGMDGLSSIEAFHARAPGTPIVAMSGSGAADFLGMAAKVGATYSLRKPFRPSELLAVIDACLSRASGASKTQAPVSSGGS